MILVRESIQIQAAQSIHVCSCRVLPHRQCPLQNSSSLPNVAVTKRHRPFKRVKRHQTPPPNTPKSSNTIIQNPSKTWSRIFRFILHDFFWKEPRHNSNSPCTTKLNWSGHKTAINYRIDGFSEDFGRRFLPKMALGSTRTSTMTFGKFGCWPFFFSRNQWTSRVDFPTSEWKTEVKGDTQLIWRGRHHPLSSGKTCYSTIYSLEIPTHWFTDSPVFCPSSYITI